MVNAISQVEELWRGVTETETFRFFKELDSSDPRAKAIADAEAGLREIIGESDPEKRLNIANRILKDGKSDLGIAHVVLARASSDFADQEKHYRAAMKNSANHIYRSKNKALDVGSELLHTAIALEFSDVLFRNSRLETAIEELQKLQSNVESMGIGQDMLDYLFAALTTYLICANKTAEARALLQVDPVPLAHWYYTNALLKFKEMGDCIQSRSALSVALNDTVIIGVIITDEDEDDDNNDDDADNDDKHDADDDDIEAADLSTDWDEAFARISLAAWKQTDGAMDWLSKCIDSSQTLFGAEEVTDEIRYKKWQREMELVEAHVRRKDFKSIKRSFKTALREAESLNDGGEMFLLTAQMLGTVLLEAGESLADLQAGFDKKIAWLDQQDSDDFESLFTSYSNFAKILFELGMRKQAKACAKKALDFFEKSIEKGTEKIDHFYSSECLFIYAVLSSREENFEEAERSFAKLIAAQEEYLGKTHIDLVDGLIGLRLCLHRLKRHEEEKLIYERLVAIDPNFDAEDEKPFVCDAVPAKAV